MAVSGLPVAGLPEGVGFGSFIEVSSGDDLNAPAINNSGQVVFFNDLTGPAVSEDNNGSLWIGGRAGLRLLAREGAPAPGATGMNFAHIRSSFLAIDGQGNVVFGALLRDDADQFARGAWVVRNNQVELLALEGTPLPNLPRLRVDGLLNEYRVNDDGRVAMYLITSEPRTGVTRRGVYLFDDDVVQPLVETGRPAPGLGVDFIGVSDNSFAFNDEGQLAFAARIDAAASDRDAGLWIVDAQGQRLLAREGDPAPGVPGERGITRRLLEFDEGLADVRGVDIGAVRSSHAKPPISMNEAGQIAYVASLAGAVADDSELAIIRDRGDGPELVARTGSLAPGTPAGSVFYEFSKLPAGLALNAEGRIAFLGTALDRSTAEFYRGVWAEDLAGELRLIVRTGDSLDVSAGDQRIVESLHFLPGSGNAEGRRSGFTDEGALAFHTSFTDGSEGVFVSRLVAVPEARAGTLCLAALVALVGAVERVGAGL